jgi:hypothetical protein
VLFLETSGREKKKKKKKNQKKIKKKKKKNQKNNHKTKTQEFAHSTCPVSGSGSSTMATDKLEMSIPSSALTSVPVRRTSCKKEDGPNAAPGRPPLRRTPSSHGKNTKPTPPFESDPLSSKAPMRGSSIFRQIKKVTKHYFERKFFNSSLPL